MWLTNFILGVTYKFWVKTTSDSSFDNFIEYEMWNVKFIKFTYMICAYQVLNELRRSFLSILCYVDSDTWFHVRRCCGMPSAFVKVLIFDLRVRLKEYHLCGGPVPPSFAFADDHSIFVKVWPTLTSIFVGPSPRSRRVK